MKRIILIYSILFIYSFLSAQQERMILRSNGERIKLDKEKSLREGILNSKMKSTNGTVATHAFIDKYTEPSSAGVVDTISYTVIGGTWNTNFGFFGQDVMMQWFVAPTNMTIKAAGFACSDETGALNEFDVGLRLIRLNWSADSLKSYISKNIYVGYYPAENDGFNNCDYFGEAATGTWIDKSTDGSMPIPPWANNPDPAANTYDYDLWSDSGKGYPILPVLQDGAGNYQWVEMNSLGFEPEVRAGEIFGVVINNNGTNLGTDRIGFYADNTIGYPGWKYYENGRNITGAPGVGDPGWWIRSYTWDFAIAADLLGCPPPRITILNPPTIAIEPEPKKVCAEIIFDEYCHGLIDSVRLVVIINNESSFCYLMEYDSISRIWCGTLPDSVQGTTYQINYFVEAYFNSGYSYSSFSYSYSIFQPTSNTLIVYNGGSAWLDPYYELNKIFDGHDIWYYGHVDSILLNYFNSVIEIQSIENGPENNNRQVVRDWLTEGNKNFLVMGQEELGYLCSYEDSNFHPGDYEYDILGVARSYNDANYKSEGDQNKPSIIKPVAGTLLGEAFNQFLLNHSIDTLWYDPDNVISRDNWIDQFEPRSDINSEVFMTCISADGIERPVGHNFINDKGNKIVFMSFDNISLDFTEEVEWMSMLDVTPFQEALKWFGLTTDIEKKINSYLNTFHLSQNYPNPFNPTTKIKYTIPNVRDAFNASRANVKLSIYDILGRKVAVLVNEAQPPGYYEVEFPRSSSVQKLLPSGVYFYTLSAGEYRATRKMILLK